MTPFTLSALTDLSTLDADTIIDVRSPSEFAEDHLPGAINLPVLDDAERARVGTIYKQQSPFDARKIGGALVAQNTARHLQTVLADRDGGWQALVYCWRGGQRSGAFATILDQVGWRVHLLKGGYQSYRRRVVNILYDTPLPHRLVVIEGGTGTAKTELLTALEAEGAQVVDLEGLAAHRGSLFGATGRDQPSQKMFESRLAAALAAHDPDRVTFVEAESSKIGERLVPPSLWEAMRAAPRVTLSARPEMRAAYLCRAYDDLLEDRAKLQQVIEQLRPYHAADRIEEWQRLAQSGDFEPLARDLIDAHYDPRYAKSAARMPQALRQYDMADLSADVLTRVARQIHRDIT